MSEILLTRDDTGKVTGLTEADQRAWSRFRKMLADLVPGECVRLAFWLPRSPKFHRRHFAIIGALFDAQEQFDDREQFRMWLQVGAGHCDFVPGPAGRMVALPKSIAWHKLDDAEFAAHHESVIGFVRSDRCTAFLWGHLQPADQLLMVETILAGFEA
ncbi:MAG: DUF1367 family protein [Rhodocyclaceae bacterium]|jgi:hypothetical protein|nr:DUF1367 family protein [Rhodocyclaceae bacterium]MCA3116400.1 DUF1367 family protein [Rhodocyclaceae bacterium]MCA3129185.1 DUF1367 family protein [Rhodocyclaceae bacterium]